jgi:hypothetical protein
LTTSTTVTHPMEKPGRLLLAIMAWQRQLVEQRQSDLVPGPSAP